MGKRSSFPRMKNDAYDTPEKPVRALLPHLLPGTRFVEPCAGRGDLILHLEAAGHACVASIDIAPRCIEGGRIIGQGDAAKHQFHPYGAMCFITNPPWTRELLHPIIRNLSEQLPTWLLFDADWPHNVTTPRDLYDRCERVVPAGRVKWIPDSKHSGVDNTAWYRFDATHSGGPRLFPRLSKLPPIVSEAA